MIHDLFICNQIVPLCTLQQFALDLLVQDLDMLPPHHFDDLVRYIEVELPQACKISNLEASIFSLSRIISQPSSNPQAYG